MGLLVSFVRLKKNGCQLQRRLPIRNLFFGYVSELSSADIWIVENVWGRGIYPPQTTWLSFDIRLPDPQTGFSQLNNYPPFNTLTMFSLESPWIIFSKFWPSLSSSNPYSKNCDLSSPRLFGFNGGRRVRGWHGFFLLSFLKGLETQKLYVFEFRSSYLGHACSRCKYLINFHFQTV